MAQSGLLDFVRQNLERTRGSWPEIAKVTRISIHKIRKIAQRKHKNPHLDKLEKLERYFKRAA